MKTKLTLIIAVAACFLCGNIFAGVPVPGAIFTTDSTCSGVDLNIYTSKGDVYLNGGPAHPGAASLPDGAYYVQVTNPGGDLLLGTSVGSGNETPFVVSGGIVQGCYQLCSIVISGGNADPNCGYDNTNNPGGEYKVWVSIDPTFTNSNTKTDNFKVDPNGQQTTLCIDKFYDANVNGIKDNGEVSINGWLFTIIADDNLYNRRFTTPLCTVVDAGLYHIFEGTPVETNWLHTTPAEVDVTLPPDRTQDNPVEFGNVCLGAGGGLTLGFWSNKNGQKLEGSGDFAMLTSLNLVDSAGQPRDFTSNNTNNQNALNTWLLNATATNMAYMLSAQLAAMELNVYNHTVSPPFGVDGNALVYAPCLLNFSSSYPTTGLNTLGFISINDLMNAANNILVPPGNYTVSASTLRSYEECLKTMLDQANNNFNFVQGSPCPFSFSQ